MSNITDFMREALLFAIQLLVAWTTLVFLLLCVLVPIAALYAWFTTRG